MIQTLTKLSLLYKTGRTGPQVNMEKLFSFLKTQILFQFFVDSLENIHGDSFSVSMWINPQLTTNSKEQTGQLHAYSFKLSASDYYYQNIENLLNLEPDYITLLRDAELGEFDPKLLHLPIYQVLVCA